MLELRSILYGEIKINPAKLKVARPLACISARMLSVLCSGRPSAATAIRTAVVARPAAPHELRAANSRRGPSATGRLARPARFHEGPVCSGV